MGCGLAQHDVLNGIARHKNRPAGRAGSRRPDTKLVETQPLDMMTARHNLLTYIPTAG